MSTLNDLVPVARIKKMDGLGMWFFVKKTKNYIQGRCYTLVDPKTNTPVGEFIPFQGIRLNNGFDRFDRKVLILCANHTGG